MNLVERIANTYGKDTEWAMRFIALFSAISENFDIFQHVCNESREAWASAACNEISCDSPRFAYFRGKSDVYNDLPTAFLSNYKAAIEANKQGDF